MRVDSRNLRLAMTLRILGGSAALCVTGVAAINNPMFSPMGSTLPDPSIVQSHGFYYLTGTYDPDGTRSVRVYRSSTLSGFLGQNAESDAIVRFAPTGQYNIWAPEIVNRDNRWWIYYSATSTDGAFETQRLYVLQSIASTVESGFTLVGQLQNQCYGVYGAGGGYAIDPHAFYFKGQWYMANVCHGTGGIGNAIYVQPMSSATTLSTVNARKIAEDNGTCDWVAEGPNTIQRNNRLFLTYSRCAPTRPYYHLETISIPSDGDPMTSAWTHLGVSLEQGNGLCGPGHHAYFRATDGSDWIVYHAKTDCSDTFATRRPYVKTISWNGDGTPNLGAPDPNPQNEPAPTNTTGLLQSWYNSRCVDVPGGNFNNTVNVWQWDCDRTNWNQVFTYNPGNKHLSINGGSHCLDDYQHGNGNGAIGIWSCDYGAGNNQSWTIQSDGRITNDKSGRCLDLDFNSSYNGGKIQVWDCGNPAGSNQRWTFTGIDTNARYKIINAGSNKGLDVLGCNRNANGTNVGQWSWIGNGCPAQFWRFTYLGSGQYAIWSEVGNNQVLDADLGAPALGANVQTWSWLNGGNQKWTIISQGGGWFRITNVFHGTMLDVQYGATTDGANVQVWQDNGSDAQKWQLLPQ